MSEPVTTEIQQTPGCLPDGYTLDSLLNPKQFCVWMRKSLRWFSARKQQLPGVIEESREHVRIHPRTYLYSRSSIA